MILAQAEEITANRHITPLLKSKTRLPKLKTDQDKEEGSRGKFGAIEF